MIISQLIMNAVLAEANAKETKAIANLQNYMSNSAGIGEHPDVVAECGKLIKQISEAREVVEVIKQLAEQSNQNQ